MIISISIIIITIRTSSIIISSSIIIISSIISINLPSASRGALSARRARGARGGPARFPSATIIISIVIIFSSSSSSSRCHIHLLL